MLAAALLFAVNGTVAKSTFAAGMDPARLTEIRNAGSLLVLAVVVAVTRPAAFRWAPGEWRLLVGYGVVGFALVQWLYFVAISLLPVGIGALLPFLAPVVVVLWHRFARHQHVDPRVWVALGLSFAGLLLVTFGSGLTRDVGGLDPVGILAGLALAVVLSVFWLLGEAGQRRRDAVSLSMWGFAFATLAWSLVRPWWSFPWDVLGRSVDPPVEAIGPVPVWLLVTWVVLLGTVVPFRLVLLALGRLGAPRAGIVAATEPAWAALVAFVVLGESLTVPQVAGGLVVLAGVVVVESARR